MIDENGLGVRLIGDGEAIVVVLESLVDAIRVD